MIFCWPDMMDDIFQQTKQCFDTTAETLLTFFSGDNSYWPANDWLRAARNQLPCSRKHSYSILNCIFQ